MTELSREILRDWQIRKTKAQKLRFIEFLQSRLPGLAVEEGGWPRCRNLVLGDPENADVIFTAHYDTCARLPFPNFVTPNNLLIYLLYQLLILLPFFAAAGLLAWGLVSLGVYAPLAMMLSWFAALVLILYVFLFGPANPHTVNDNTSGVVMLCELIAALSEEERSRCAFVFFDHEETGLFGSAYFRSQHKKSPEKPPRYQLRLCFGRQSHSDRPERQGEKARRRGPRGGLLLRRGQAAAPLRHARGILPVGSGQLSLCRSRSGDEQVSHPRALCVADPHAAGHHLRRAELLFPRRGHAALSALVQRE